MASLTLNTPETSLKEIPVRNDFGHRPDKCETDSSREKYELSKLPQGMLGSKNMKTAAKDSSISLAWNYVASSVDNLPLEYCEPVLALAVAFALAVLLWVRTRRRKARFERKMPRRNTKEGMEQILRTTRERASTFDFFGMHTPERERSGSWGAISERDDSFRRERMGSMDLFYSAKHLENLEAKKKTTKSHSERGLSNASNPTHSAIPSENFFSTQLAAEEEGYLYDEFGLVTVSFHVIYYGPSHTSLQYSTWTPPTSWAEASRRIFPQDIMLKLQRTLVLDVNQAQIIVKEPKSSGQWDFSLPVRDVSIHVKSPMEGGVMNLYVKGTPRDEWMEYTFDSAQDAAQFQLDLLAYQVLGKTLHHMFEVLSLVHLGSSAYDGHEFVLHDDSFAQEDKEESTEESRDHLRGGGVAWDDAMRALSSIPTVRIALERLWLSHRRPATSTLDYSKNKKGDPPPSAKDPADDVGLLTEEYTNKRLLLGPVDFFRLFVPALPETAVPQSESNRSRMEQLLSWRKRAARAAVLVRAYTMSHRVVNLGWQLSFPVDESSGTITKRLAYDDNEDNNRRDIASKNEFYEASVSRDVLCHVRPFDYFSQKERYKGTDGGSNRSLVLSPYQAYSLVGAHIFKIPPKDDGDHPLFPSRDTVEAFPSLRKLISDNPGLEFFVVSYYIGNAVSIFCYVRSLPKGIDPQFDNVIDRFTHGTEEVRCRKVHMMMQMGHSLKLSFAGMLVLRILSFLFGLTKKGRESPVGLEATRDRTVLPAIRLANYSEMYHFGGALQTDPELPKNYVSMSSNFSSKLMPNSISRLLFTRLEGMHDKVLDFTFVLEGEQEDELPERALYTTRMVHVDTDTVAKAASFNVRKHRPRTTTKSKEEEPNFRRWARKSLVGVVNMIGSPLRAKRTDTEHQPKPLEIKTEEGSHGELVVSEDPIEIATNEIMNILRGVDIPIRKLQELSILGEGFSNVIDVFGSEDMISVPVLQTTSRNDMKRFIRASRFDIKESSVRIVQTAAWRGRTFPVDIRKCRIELQNGQFFQQGFDLERNPVFYFRNMCLGPWRGDANAVISAIVHRFDTSLTEFCKSNPETKCTLVVLMGRPRGKDSDEDEDDATEVGQEAEDDGSLRDTESLVDTEQIDNVANPRISVNETWQRHTNKELVEKLVNLLSVHYPERLSKVLVVKGTGKNFYFRTRVEGRGAMKHLIYSLTTRSKVKFVKRTSELRTYVDDSELSTIVGGSAPINHQTFEVR